ncbi:MAG: hypothetical protein JWM04_2349 [Verrucomicrobiales bacterium]|nr:hypothetical protein [Verrucomicrobiales bacterium]
MKAFECDHCGNLVFFDNTKCLKCGHPLGFQPDALDLTALNAKSDATGQLFSGITGDKLYRLCKNGQDYGVCNWLVQIPDTNELCVACRLNETIPNLSVPGNLELWGRWERAKHHAVYTLLQLGLPLEGDAEKNQPGLHFRFLADSPGAEPVLTGHLSGTITLNIAEGDDVEREKRRVNLHEPYRTLVGHFRHEVGHYYWDRLVWGTPRLERFRALFGDETKDYGEALKIYYAKGPPQDWQDHFVTAYATAHPWEDWAESWAHYLHIVDTIETANSFGMSLRPRHPSARTMTFEFNQVTPFHTDFERIVKNWIPLTYALNSLNRGMGLHDLYPFVLSTPALDKLGFIHQIIRDIEEGKTAGS